ncbi:MAG: acylneuraminate cytidylyltransferase family protein [Phycisphaerae bacterium]|nr:acylneuraminate cytidylyltransferase family protein [Phycisphaerae bacterium]
MENKKILGLIPARAGSVGVPGKNVRLLMGKPVISYSIDTARESKFIDKISVSSDDAKVMELCKALDDVVFVNRPEELASNSSRVDDAMRHCLRCLKEEHGYEPDIVVLLYANIPVRSDTIIDRAIEKLIETDADSVQSFTDPGKFHPYWLYQLENDGAANKYIPNKIYRRQELPSLYAVDGAVAVIKTSVLLDAKGNDNPHAFFGTKRRAVIQQPHETVDIDSQLDFYLAEAVLRAKENK